MDNKQIECAILPELARAYPLRADSAQPLAMDLGTWSVDGKKAQIYLRVSLRDMHKLVAVIYRSPGHSKTYGGGALTVFRNCGAGDPQEWDED